MFSKAVHNLIDPLGSPVSLGQLLDLKGLEEILASFYAVFRIPVRILDEDGTTLGRSRKPSALNEYLGTLPAARKRLGDEHQLLRQHDPSDSAEFSHTAFNGASYHVSMIGHDGRRVGRFILGPFITPAVQDVPASLGAVDSSLDLQRCRQLLLASPRVREDTIRAIARHLTTTLDVLIFAGHRALLSEFMHLSTVQENQRQLSAKDAGLQAAEERLQQTERLQADFLVTALSELRSPLESIMGHSETLTRADPANSEQRDLVLGIRQRAAQLLGLSQRLLDFTQADRSSLSLRREAIDVPALLKRVASKLSALAPERANDLSLRTDSGLPPFFGDAACVEHVLMLLGENALRFAPDGEICLHACRAAEDPSDDGDGMVLFGGPPERIEFGVSDSGIGIPDVEKGRVFEPFYQAPPPSDSGIGKATGSGLGLATAKRLIEAHGGSIRVEDNTPRGTRFLVIVPAAGSSALT
jgi:two-component system sensor histidine kinase BarA